MIPDCFNCGGQLGGILDDDRSVIGAKAVIQILETGKIGTGDDGGAAVNQSGISPNVSASQTRSFVCGISFFERWAQPYP